MSMRADTFQFRFPGRLCWLLLMAGSARADTALMDASPFLPAGASVAPVAAEGSIEFHGYLATGEGERFSIYNPATKTATWVGLNEAGRPFLVRAHKIVGSDTDQITVEYQGRTLVLALKAAKITAVTLPVMPAFGPPPFAPAPGAAPAVQGTPPALPAGASLDDWAAEVQRRRALRQQATPATSNPPPAPGGLPSISPQK
jgi:hypothetical protein